MTISRKTPGWRLRLHDYVERLRAEPFAHGRHDCALFAAGAVEAMTGVDPAAAFRGRYASADEGAMLLLAEFGARGPIDVARDLLEQVPPAMAATGDVALVDTPQGRALGVVMGGQILVPGEGGLMALPLERCRGAFRAPD